ncbi:MAG: site-2 protease family protein [Acidobacteria bacterium]|nr:site-2 protease family protein [Acidobacteriota bacterium]
MTPDLLPILLALPDLKGVLGIVGALGGLIFVHELGHFLMAKRMGMPVEVFSLGFGPRLVGFKWRETDVRLSALPLGGYVKLAGYNPEEPDAEDPHGFLQQPAWKRLLFYAGGVIFNVLAAWLCLMVVAADLSRVTKFEERWAVGQVAKGSRAEQGGLKRGDVLVRIGDLRFPGADWGKEVLPAIQASPEKAVPFVVQRDGKELTLNLVPANEGGKGRLGFGPEIQGRPLERRALTLKDLRDGAVQGTQETLYLTGGVAAGIGKLVVGKASVKDMGGPGTIGVMAYRTAQIGWTAFLRFLAFISLNLAVLNALPIPFLDGGHAAILLFEKLRGRDLAIKVKERILMGGFVFLMGLMGLVIFLDILRFRK